MEVYQDFGLHSMFASSLILQHTRPDERFSHEKLYKEGKHYPRPMRYGAVYARVTHSKITDFFPG